MINITQDEREAARLRYEFEAHATAAQRAEAFLCATGKWRGES
jgi:hypothetical protein